MLAPDSRTAANTGSPTVHRDVVLLALEPVRAGHAAAHGVDLGGPQPGDQAHQAHRRRADAVPALLAGRVVGHLHVDRPEIGRHLAAVVEHLEVLADVVEARADHLEVLVLHAQDLAGLALEHQRAARGGGHDVVAGARVGGQLRGQAAHVAARVGEDAVALERQPAAALLGNDHLEAVVLEHRDGLLGGQRLVVVGAAAVEVDDGALRAGRVRRTAPLAGPVLERPARPGRHRGRAVDAHRLLEQRAHERRCSSSSWRSGPPGRRAARPGSGVPAAGRGTGCPCPPSAPPAPGS